MQPDVSLVIVELEEPVEVARTVISALESAQRTSTSIEIIVVDDCSVHPPAFEPVGKLPKDPRVNLVVQKRRYGLGRNKNAGVKMTTGKTIIPTDAHMRFPGDLIGALHQQAQELQGVVQPVNRSFGCAERGKRIGKIVETDAKGKPVTTSVFSCAQKGKVMRKDCDACGRDALGTGAGAFYGHGAYLFYNPYPNGCGVSNAWRWRGDRALCPADKTHEVPALLGACYAFPRTVWERIDGCWNTFDTWGFLEEHWTLKLWFAGVPIYLDPTREAWHKYWKSASGVDGFVRPFHTPGNPRLRNAAPCLYSMFGDTAWERWFRPQFDDWKTLRENGYYPRILTNELVQERRSRFLKVKVVSDEEVMRRLQERKPVAIERAEAKKKLDEPPDDAPVPMAPKAGPVPHVERLGVIRLHQGNPFLVNVVGELAKHVEHVLFVLNEGENAPVKDAKAAAGKVATSFAAIPNHWRRAGSLAEESPTKRNANAQSLESTARHIDRFSPRLVVLIDEDEVLPPTFANMLTDFDASGKTLLMMRPVISWGDLDHIRGRFDYRTNWHCKGLRWNRSISYWPTYGGRCRPGGTQTEYHAPYPYLHTAWTMEGQRQARIAARGLPPWKNAPLTVIAYSPDMTWAQFVGRPEAVKVEPSVDRVILNLGCGSKQFRGAINVDPRPGISPDVIATAQDFMKARPNLSADTVIMYHVIEHLPCVDVPALLKNIYRALRPGGELVLEWPELGAMLRRILEHPESAEETCRWMFGVGKTGPHLFGYTSEMLTTLLRDAGFQTLRWEEATTHRKEGVKRGDKRVIATKE